MVDAVHEFASTKPVRLAGTVITGAVWSTTVTVNDDVAVLPAASTPV